MLFREINSSYHLLGQPLKAEAAALSRSVVLTSAYSLTWGS